MDRSAAAALLTASPAKAQQNLERSVGLQIWIEWLSLTIDAAADPEALKTNARQLLQAWQTQRAATNWVIGKWLHTKPAR